MKKIKLIIKTTLLILIFILTGVNIKAQIETKQPDFQELPELTGRFSPNKEKSNSLNKLKNKRPTFFSINESTVTKEQKSNLPVNQNQNNYVRPTAKKRFQRYVNSMFGVYALAGTGIRAGIAQANQNPPEWEKNTTGFFRRLGSGVGQSVIKQTVAYGLEEALKLDSKFYKSTTKNFGARFRNALLSPFTARTPSGKRVFNPSGIIGNYTSKIIAAETWYPDRFNYRDGLRQGTKSIAFSVGFSFLREFLFPKK